MDIYGTAISIYDVIHDRRASSRGGCIVASGRVDVLQHGILVTIEIIAVRDVVRGW